MMKLEVARPVAALGDCVRYFQQREACIAGSALVYPIAARPAHILEFYLQQRYVVRLCQSGEPDIVPRAVVVGPSTHRRADLVLHGRFQVFTIHFQAAGFHRLFRVPMGELVDRAYDARSVVGVAAAEIEQKLAEASGFRQRVSAATEFLLLQQRRERPPFDPIAVIANRLLLERGTLRVVDAATCAGLSVRQFERRFVEQVGLPPKIFAAIVRFDAALDAKLGTPARLWTDIAHEFGYYDQMHMVHDFKRFAGESPTIFTKRIQAMAEPWG